jgi:exopolysaccharide biosynthesis polyprenyl glycosylphosphotransferase
VTEGTQTTERMAEARSAPTFLPSQDVRRRRPPALSFLLRMETLRRLLRVASLMTIDFVALTLAIYTGLLIKQGIRMGNWTSEPAFTTTQDYVSFAFLLVVLLFAKEGLYADRPARPGLPKIVTALFQATLVALVYALIATDRDQYSSYYIFYGSLFFSIVYIGSFRLAYQKVTGWMLRKAGYRRRAVLVGTGEHIEAVAHALSDEVSVPIQMIGFISLTPRPDNGLRSLGRIEELPRVLDEHGVQEVIIADSDFPEDLCVELVDVCHRRGVHVRIAPSTMDILVGRAEFVPGATVPLFELRPPVFEGFDYVVKRTFDFVGACLLILVLSPLMALIAAAVAMSSRGGILYRSARPGIGGRNFSCFKFRTMHSNADQMQADLESVNEASGALFKIRDDPRMTRVGRLLRRYSLDELPQLFNVIGGQMSLVGPRPLPLRDFERLEEWHKKRYLVMPGITGLWQVSGRSDLDFDDLVRLDFLYLERWSVGLDLSILLKTIPAVLQRRGAY